MVDYKKKYLKYKKKYLSHKKGGSMGNWLFNNASSVTNAQDIAKQEKK